MKTVPHRIFQLGIRETAIFLLLLCSCNRTATQSTLESRYDVVYRSWESAASDVVVISLELDRRELATNLKTLVAAMHERWPSGLSPNIPRLPDGTITEELVITRRGGRPIRFELLPISHNVFNSLSEDEQLGRSMFIETRDELLRVIAHVGDYTSRR